MDDKDIERLNLMAELAGINSDELKVGIAGVANQHADTLSLGIEALDSCLNDLKEHANTGDYEKQLQVLSEMFSIVDNMGVVTTAVAALAKINDADTN